MIPTRISLRGFMSYRDPQELSFEEDGLFVLEGKNGVGKSTLFDAITFVLFGQHRLGKQNHTELINHECDQLEVTLVLRLEERRFRLHRTVPRKGRATWQIAELSPDGQSRPVANTEQKRGYEEWVVKNIGLDYEAFTTSVLLLQGESEKLLGKLPEQRRQVLAQLIDLSRYEKLYELAKKREDEHQREADRLARELTSYAPARPEELHAAEVALAAARAERTRLDEATEALDQLLPLAQQHEQLLLKEQALQASVLAQQAVLAQAAEIRAAVAELADLDPLRRPLEEMLAGKKAQMEAQEATIAAEERVTILLAEEAAARQAEVEARQREDALRQQEDVLRQQEEAARTEREQLAPLRARWQQAEALRLRCVARLAQAQVLPQEADEAAARALRDQRRVERDACSVIEANTSSELQQSHRRLTKLAPLLSRPGGGEPVSCELCGQEVTAAHAQAEHQALLRERARLEAVVAAARANRTDAEAALRQAEDAYDQTLRGAARRQELEIALATDERQRTELLAGLSPAVAQAAELRLGELQPLLAGAHAQRETLRRELNATQAAVGAAAQRRHHLEQERRRMEGTLTDQRARRQQAAGQQEAWRAQLPERLHQASPTDLAQLDDRLAVLRSYGERARQLMQAEAHPASRQLAETAARRAEIPPAAQRPPQELVQAREVLRREREAAERRRDDCAEVLKRLHQALQRRADLDSRHQAAAQERDLYGRLADLLGPKGLLRRLVRDAEQEIVRLANAELTGLTHGRIRLGLRPGEDGEDGAPKALDLMVVNQETGEQPTALALASGSQKFRIAISLALGIGRYLARETRRIDSVIIDEGFGCLDQASREDAVTVLRELSTHLPRVILVSHQEEFYRRFSSGYRIDLVDRTSVPTRVSR